MGTHRERFRGNYRKRWRILILLGVVASSWIPWAFAEMTLLDAWDEALVTVEFSGRGASSGDAILLVVARTDTAGDAELTLAIEPGTILRSASRGKQSMAVAGVRGRALADDAMVLEDHVVVPPEGEARYILEAYCAEFYKANPTPKTRFALQAPEPNLSCILSIGKRRELSIDALQAAVWIQTDEISRDDLVRRFPVSDEEWQAAVELARGCCPQPAEVVSAEEPPEHRVAADTAPVDEMTEAKSVGWQTVVVANRSGEPVEVALQGAVVLTVKLVPDMEVPLELMEGFYDIRLRYGTAESYRDAKARVQVAAKTKLIPIPAYEDVP